MSRVYIVFHIIKISIVAIGNDSMAVWDYSNKYP